MTDVDTAAIQAQAQRYHAIAKLEEIWALCDEPQTWGRGNPEVLFFERDIRAILDREEKQRSAPPK